MIGIIIQARTGSSRYPRKIYEDICGKTTIQRVLEGCNQSQLAHRIILAMPKYDEGEFWERQGYEQTAITSKHIDQNRFKTYFGDPDDLLNRYTRAAQIYGIDLIVRITGDCPLVQGNLIDQALIKYLKNGWNGYVGSNYRITSIPYPTGCHLEIFPYWMLIETHKQATSPSDREHVCSYMYRKNTQFKTYPFHNSSPNTTISNRFSDFSFDTEEDLRLIKAIVEEYDKHGDLNKAILDARESR